MHRTAEEVRDEYVQVMGEELGQLYYELYNELAWLHSKWQQYRELFGRNKELIDLLNKAAPYFFWLLQHTLLDDILLHLARLTDPPQSMGRDNLTMRRLPPLITDSASRAKLEAALKQVLHNCDFARKWRNKQLAHIDLATKRAPELLPPRTRKSVEDALAAMRRLMNSLAKHYGLAEVAYELGIGDLGGADRLVHYLVKGLRAEEVEWQGRRGGNAESDPSDRL